ncbi:MAG: hypothetical protein FJW96_00550 [Actinobacteria bacterium]|nr:hypothetical protein [Actinomycetota bacterium]
MGRLSFIVGDLTSQDVDAIVNAANDRLLPGGGVCGAILRAGGEAIFEEAARIGHCAPGDAVITGAGRLRARHVVHAVGPVWQGGDHGESGLLASAYRRSLEVAAAAGCRTIAFPALSTGIYGYPLGLAADVAVGAVAPLVDRFDEIRFVFLDAAARGVFAVAAGEAGAGNEPGSTSGAAGTSPPAAPESA